MDIPWNSFIWIALGLFGFLIIVVLASGNKKPSIEKKQVAVKVVLEKQTKDTLARAKKIEQVTEVLEVVHTHDELIEAYRELLLLATIEAVVNERTKEDKSEKAKQVPSK